MNSLKDYGDLFERLDLTELSVEEGDFKLTLKKKINTISVNKNMIEDDSHNSQAVSEKEAEKTVQQGTEVKSPLLGIFYGKVGEREPLKIGDKVHKGDCICTIEAMKMLNEVQAPVDGEIKEILAKEGDLVEYNQVLFVID